MSNCKREVEFIESFFYPLFDEIGSDYIKVSLFNEHFAIEKNMDKFFLLTPDSTIEISEQNISNLFNGFLEYQRGRKKRLFDYLRHIEWSNFVQLAQKYAHKFGQTTYERIN